MFVFVVSDIVVLSIRRMSLMCQTAVFHILKHFFGKWICTCKCGCKEFCISAV